MLPPYESVLEERFANVFLRFARKDVKMETQVTCKTLCGDFRPDFIITEQSGRKIAIECDGKDYHNEHRDEWRDAMLIGDDFVDEIYRIRGVDIKYNLNEILLIMTVLGSILLFIHQLIQIIFMLVIH